ncbi:MAG TPA: hypothetical protein VHW01_10190 [Polyangiaceae bacterium]|nr:hypothetical protein [Polyangiaceae bacterium]
MTKRQDTADQEACKQRSIDEIENAALRRFGQKVFDAGRAYEEELEKRTTKHPDGIKYVDVRRGKDFEMAKQIASFLGVAFLSPPISADDRRKPARIHSALRPSSTTKDDGKAVELAERVVRKYAQMFHAVTPGSPHPSLPSPFTIPAAEQLLVPALVSEVHAEFRRLKNRRSEIRELLSRFSSGKGRKAKAGELTRLTASGILCELMRMASWPLGPKTVKSIDQAIRRIRKSPLQ